MADSSELDGQESEEHASSNPRASPHTTAASSSININMNHTQDQDGTVGESGGPSPRKMRSPRRRATGVAGVDTQSTDTKSSVVSGDSGGLVTISPKHKDPDRIRKDREREERVRQARERLEEERKRKLIDLQEQQRQAQENREKQLEMRRRRIEDMRRRDVERRAEVEKRRRDRENADRNRRETLLMKAEERVARYEAWKRGGQKGPPPGGDMPTAKHLSASTSVLYHKRNSDFSSSGVLSDSNRPESLLALNTIPEGRRSVLAPSAPLPTRPKSVVTLNISSTSSSSSGGGGGMGVRLREHKAGRKPRPASVGTSMPSFLTLEPPKASVSSPRSKSTDRLARERSRPRGSGSSRRSEEKDKEKSSGEKSTVKMSRRTLDRLSTPRQMASLMGDSKKEPTTSTPKRETNVVRMSARKAYSTSNLTVFSQKSATREKTPKETPSKSQQPPAAPSPIPAAVADSASPSSSRTSSRTPVRVVSPTPGADEDGGSGVTPARSTQPSGAEKSSSADISAEEYKAKLAEKRRQAREKAEREAEEERRRQEELEREEEERRQQEEEEQRRQDEETMRLAEEARKVEEERLQKAIEAEEARRAEEAARLEQERVAKEEADRKAKEEAEKQELERQEKARRDEEERLERKKRLEMIMKRVKTESPGEGAKDSVKSVTSSPSKSINSTASSDTSPTDPDNKTVQAMAAATATDVNGQDVSAKPLVSASSLDEDAAAAAPQDRAGGKEEVSAVSAPSPLTVTDQEPAAEVEETTDKLATMGKPEGGGDAPDSSSFPTSPAPHTEGVGAEKPKFKSPLLQKLVEGKEDAGSSPGPRFKSPLLQNLLGKTKARSMGAQDHSVSDPNLSQMAGGNGNGHAATAASASAASFGDVMSSSMVDMGTGSGDAAGQKEATTNSSEEKDVDTSEEDSSSRSSPSFVSGKYVSNGSEEVSSIAAPAPSHEDSISALQPEPMEISTPMESSVPPAVMAASTASFWSQQDSGVCLAPDDLRPAAPSGSLQVSFNGHGPSRLLQSQGLEDSSISMRSVESSVSSSITDSAAGSVFSSLTSLPPGQSLPVSSDKDFEELIELPVNNKAASSTTTTTTSSSPSLHSVLDNSEDLVNFNKVEEGSEDTTAVPPPIIAFEERHQDVPDLLS